MRTEIVYDSATKRYALYINDERVGSAPTYHDAEIALAELLFALAGSQYFREAA